MCHNKTNNFLYSPFLPIPSMKWRLISLETNNAFYNMAVDQAIAESVYKTESLPTIRFYKWNPAAVSLGNYQKELDINLDLCKKLGIDCVRRITGGRAIYHNLNDITYSVVMPLKSIDIHESYKKVCGWLLDSLNLLGINSQIRNKNDIVVNKKKISGNAAKILNSNIFLQHGTLICDLNNDLTANLLKIKDKSLIGDRVTSVLEHASVSENVIYAALKKGFLKDKDYEISNLNEKEMKRVNVLIREYKSLKKRNNGQNRGSCYLNWGD